MVLISRVKHPSNLTVLQRISNNEEKEILRTIKKKEDGIFKPHNKRGNIQNIATNSEREVKTFDKERCLGFEKLENDWELH